MINGSVSCSLYVSHCSLETDDMHSMISISEYTFCPFSFDIKESVTLHCLK